MHFFREQRQSGSELGRSARRIAFGPTIYRNRLAAFREEQRCYAEEPPNDEIHRLQLARLNSVWGHCLERVPFYQWWAKEHELPQRFTDLSELRELPRLTKAVLVDHADEVFEAGRIKSSVMTGGSTGTPARYPWSPSDAATVYANRFSGRGWWGIRPFDPQVAFWGHQHVFGTDWKRHVRAARRGLAYLTANTVKLSAYERGPEAFSPLYERLRRLRPAYLYGYTSALYRFAKHLETNSLPVPLNSPLKGVVMTGETVTPRDVALVERVFSAPAIVEYGGSELGPVAYSSPGRDGLRVFWRSFIVQADDEGHAVITTTGSRRFPLINYDIGDVIDAGHDQSDALLELPRVRGRRADVVRMRTREGGTRELMALLLVHVMKSLPGVLAIQFRQGDAGALQVYLTTHAPLDTAAARDHFLSTVTGEFPDIAPDSVTVHRVSEPILTPAGKTPILV